VGTLFDLVLEFITGIPTELSRGGNRPLPGERIVEGGLWVLIIAPVAAFVWWRNP
jgi:hypothetical protein